jgi:hypothetical protein
MYNASFCTVVQMVNSSTAAKPNADTRMKARSRPSITTHAHEKRAQVEHRSNRKKKVDRPALRFGGDVGKDPAYRAANAGGKTRDRVCFVAFSQGI